MVTFETVMEIKILHVTNGAIVIHTQRLKSDPGGNLLS
ncbi:coproporphyrinogen III oxidase (plasmid) [Klebsiella pneumoniae]|nr:coproporphyrinogen III oxidase [Klebsiella pneumoniae]